MWVAKLRLGLMILGLSSCRRASLVEHSSPKPVASESVVPARSVVVSEPPAAAMIREHHDAVSQKEIAARMELDCATISQVFHTLIDKDMLSVDLDMGGKAWRIYLSDRAKRLLREQRPCVEAVSLPSCQ